MGACACASTYRNPSNARTPPMPASGADSMKANTMPPRLTVASSAPVQSNLAEPSPARLSGTRHSVSTRTAAPNGRLMKNAHLQDACCTSQPPNTGPIAAVMDVKPDQVPIARPLSASEKLTLISAKLPGTSSAPPIPCTPRAITNGHTPGASPHHADAAQHN